MEAEQAKEEAAEQVATIKEEAQAKKDEAE